jgi:predicted DNA-binding transcriptional regulator YafY
MNTSKPAGGKGDSRNTMERWLIILRMLPTASPGLTPQDISAHLIDNHSIDVSIRTVQRDLEQLKALLPLVHEGEKPRRWLLDRNQDMRFGQMSMTEAFSLDLVGRHIASTLSWNTEMGMKTLLKTARERLRQASGWHQKVRYVPPAFPLRTPDINAEFLDSLHEAMQKGVQIEITYQAIGFQHDSRIILSPLGIMIRLPSVYLIASRDNDDQVRQYALHRIRQVSLQASPLRTPDKFDLDQYLDEGHGHFLPSDRGLASLVLSVNEQQLAYLQETPLREQHVLGADENRPGWTLVHATVYDTWQLRWWILSLGQNAVVLSPDNIRNSIIEEVRGMLGAYDA